MRHNIKNKNPEIVTTPLKLERGDVCEYLKKSKYKISGEIYIGGQDHFYLESHIAMARIEESEEVIILSSTQHPTEVQHMVAKVLDIPFNKVIVKVKRMGGGFGGMILTLVENPEILPDYPLVSSSGSAVLKEFF
mgnify:CR=1 FL=1